MIRRTKVPGRRPGTTIVEVAFVALICFTFMFAIFEYGRYVMTRQIMENAARQGGRTAVVMATSYITPAVANANLNASINQAMAGQDQKLANFVITAFQSDANGNNVGPWTNTPFGQNIVVQLDGDLPLMFPTFGFITKTGGASNSAHITVKCMMRGEAN